MPEKMKPDAVVAWLRFVCKFIYWSGLGDFWYEPTKRSTLRKILYTIVALANISYFIVMVCCEIGSFFKTKILPAERTDALQFSIAHTFIPVKWMFMLIHRKSIKKLLKMMLVSSRELYVNEKIEREQVRKSHAYCFTLAFSMMVALTSALIDSVVRYFRTGFPWRTLVTIYPDYDDLSRAAFWFRGFSTFFWYHLIIVMLSADFLAITSLIYVAFMFKSLQSYFLSLETRFKQNPMKKSQEELEDDMRTEFVNGLKMHKDILWCAHCIQTALGNVYTIVISQSVTLLANCLIKMVMNEERSFMYYYATVMFIVCMLILCGVYMWTAGEVTYETTYFILSERYGPIHLSKLPSRPIPDTLDSKTDDSPYQRLSNALDKASLVSDAMFHSGWHLCGPRARMRKLVVVGIIRSQVPVFMTAYGVFNLSYDNFIKILKTSYSVFAVFY